MIDESGKEELLWYEREAVHRIVKETKESITISDTIKKLTRNQRLQMWMKAVEL